MSLSVEENAVAFVNLLTPGNFAEAKEWLSEVCEYEYQNSILKGHEIIQSFLDNHEKAIQKIQIEYLDGQVNKTQGSTVYVGVKDRLIVGHRTHIYEDCLEITSNDKRGPGSIDRIKHRPIKEERQKLTLFLESVGVNF